MYPWVGKTVLQRCLYVLQHTQYNAGQLSGCLPSYEGKIGVETGFCKTAAFGSPYESSDNNSNGIHDHSIPSTVKRNDEPKGQDSTQISSISDDMEKSATAIQELN